MVWYGMVWCGKTTPINKARAIYVNKDPALWFTRLLYMLSDAVAEPGPLDGLNKTDLSELQKQ